MRARTAWLAFASCCAAAALSAAADAPRARAARRDLPPATPFVSPADCAGETLPTSCRDGGPSPHPPLTAAEVERLARNATASLDDPGMSVAVVDRAGRVLALLRNPAADPANDDLAVGLARTAASFSHNMAPLTPRTIRFISGVHFPPGIERAPNGALYGVENTNRGCDLHITFNPGKCIPRPTSVRGGRCDAFDRTGCGSGPITGKPDPLDGHAGGRHPDGLGLRGPANPGGLPVDPGGAPIYRVGGVRIAEGSLDSGDARVEVDGPGYLVGGIGVAGTSSPESAEFAAFAAVALAGGDLFPAPSFPLPAPGRVVLDGFRLPYVDQGIRPAGTREGDAGSGSFTIEPRAGGCAANRYLAGPKGSGDLSVSAVDALVRNTVAAAEQTRAAIRLPPSRYTRMVVAVSDLEGEILALYRMPDATVFSIDVAVAKARNVVWFSGEGTRDLAPLPPGRAVTNRSIGLGAQPLFPPGIDSSSPGPFFDLFLADLDLPCSQGSQPANPRQNGVVFFPGSLPLYLEGRLVGGLGVSGDGVEQDDWVSWLGAVELRPPEGIWSDGATIDGVRIPLLKFPRHPGGVAEPVSEPFDEP